ncbi:MAG: methylenetetrahydrofolate reductase [NAD(P)H] [Planctomycetaceae bacterium]
MPTRISEIYTSPTWGLSVEIFPPKTSEGDTALFDNLDQLSRYRPAFISCTYGAGGSTSKRTVELCVEIQRRYDITATAHFTCMGGTREELLNWLKFAHESGIRNIMALRGDPAAGQAAFEPVSGGFRNAYELVSLIRESFDDLGIGVAGYPEKHPEAESLEADIQNLRRKVDLGADAVYTQLFYRNDYFFDFRERCRREGIEIPIVPGIMPITEFARIKRITSMCGAVIPEELARKLEAAKDDLPGQFEIGVDFAIAQCRELIESGVPGIHFYALNRSQACERILQAIGRSPQGSAMSQG